MLFSMDQMFAQMAPSQTNASAKTATQFAARTSLPPVTLLQALSTSAQVPELHPLLEPSVKAVVQLTLVPTSARR